MTATATATATATTKPTWVIFHVHSVPMSPQICECKLKYFCDFVSSDSKHLFIFYRTQHHTLNVLLSAHSCDHFTLSLAALLRSNHRASGQTRKLRTRTKTLQQPQISLLSLLYRIHRSNALPPLLPCIHLFPFINVLSCHVGPRPFKAANLAED